MKKAVFLDRDGVINDLVYRNNQPNSPICLGDMKILPRVKEAVDSLKNAGYLCIVVTNKPDIARGLLSYAELSKMHNFMTQATGLELIYFCPHDDNQCDCRKPLTGMIEKAVRQYGIDLKRSFVVGDRWRDVEMGKKSGCRTVLVISKSTEQDNRKIDPDFITMDLWEAAQIIIRHGN